MKYDPEKNKFKKGTENFKSLAKLVERETTYESFKPFRNHHVVTKGNHGRNKLSNVINCENGIN